MSRVMELFKKEKKRRIILLTQLHALALTQMANAMNLMGAGGQNTKAKGQAIVNSIIVVVAGIGGLFLIAVAIKG